MRLVHLKLPSEDNEYVDFEIAANFTERELQLLRDFSGLTQRVRVCTLLQRGMRGFQGLSFDQAGLSIRAGTCSKPELHELLHVLRPVTLQRERASFGKVTEILRNRITKDPVQQFLRLNQRLFLGLSEAQLIAAMLVAIGAFGMAKLSGGERPGARIA